MKLILFSFFLCLIEISRSEIILPQGFRRNIFATYPYISHVRPDSHSPRIIDVMSHRNNVGSNRPPVQVMSGMNRSPPVRTGMFARMLPPQNTFATPEQPRVTINGPGPVPSLEHTLAMIVQPFASVLRRNSEVP